MKRINKISWKSVTDPFCRNFVYSRIICHAIILDDLNISDASCGKKGKTKSMQIDTNRSVHINISSNDTNAIEFET